MRRKGSRGGRVLGRAVCAVIAVACLFPTATATARCTMASAQPDSGTLTLRYVQSSTKNKNRNDYRLSGTVRWNSASALACFAAGRVDWAYEHNITYQQWFDRKIWSVDFSAFPDSAAPYIDTTVSDTGNRTDHSFGIFRPDKLKAGIDYRFAYSLFLPNKPSGDTHRFYVAGQVLERHCSRAGPWCVNTRWGAPTHGSPFIGTNRAFAVTGTTCWTWRRGKAPTSCTSGGGRPTPAPAPAPVTSPPPAPRVWREQQGSLGANTFKNPYNASGMGQKIPAWAWVDVSCKVYAPQIVSANPDGYWYRIASAPWSNAYYAVANTFWNGDVAGQRPYTHNTDWAVPNC